jgi:hypothetical protein
MDTLAEWLRRCPAYVTCLLFSEATTNECPVVQLYKALGSPAQIRILQVSFFFLLLFDYIVYVICRFVE